MSVDESQEHLKVFVVNTGNTSFSANLRWEYYLPFEIFLNLEVEKSLRKVMFTIIIIIIIIIIIKSLSTEYTGYKHTTNNNF